MDLFGTVDAPAKVRGRYYWPPTSVFNANDGSWRKRKKEWLSVGIQSELGRFDAPGQEKKPWKQALATSQWFTEKAVGFGQNRIASVFDPVLCELMYRWFAPPGGTVLDSCAGGSVRGITAGVLGRHYTGIDIREEQCEANRVQALEVAPQAMPKWICGDGCNTRFLMAHRRFDFFFTCPPYGNLEVYSDRPDDLSTMDYPVFLEKFTALVHGSIACLKNDRFACIVVGDFRQADGTYRNFVSHTIEAFETAGARLYNELILITQYNTVPVRAGRYFMAARKVGKTHQNVLVFVKGDPGRAAQPLERIEL